MICYWKILRVDLGVDLHVSHCPYLHQLTLLQQSWPAQSLQENNVVEINSIGAGILLFCMLFLLKLNFVSFDSVRKSALKNLSFLFRY